MFGVSTFTPRSSHISNAMFTSGQLQPAIDYQPGSRQAQCITVHARRCDSWSVGLFDVSCFMRGCSGFLYTFCVYSRKLVHVQ